MKKILLVLAFAFGLFQLQQGGHLDGLLDGAGVTQSGSASHSQLLAQDQQLYNTLERISRNGPFPYQRDGITWRPRGQLEQPAIALDAETG